MQPIQGFRALSGSAAKRPPEQLHKITRVGAGYVYRPGCDYRCRECWKFLADTERCASLGSGDVVRADGYCILWEHSSGTQPKGLKPTGSYTPQEVGYGEKPDGTLCRKCEYFDSGHCEIVRGDIEPGACCDNHEP